MSEKKEKKQSISSPSSSWLSKLTTPLTTAPSKVADSAANKIDTPRIGSSMFNPSSVLGKAEGLGNQMNAMVRGGLAGMTQGVGNLVSDMTSPLSIAATAAGAGPVKKALSGIGKAVSPTIDVIDTPLPKQVVPEADEVTALINDLQKNLAKIPKKKTSISSPTTEMTPFLPPDLVPVGKEALFNTKFMPSRMPEFTGRTIPRASMR